MKSRLELVRNPNSEEVFGLAEHAAGTQSSRADKKILPEKNIAQARKHASGQEAVQACELENFENSGP